MKHEGWGDKKNTTSQEESVLDGILRFLEVLNRIKRLQPPKVPQTPKVSWTKGKKYFRTILCEVLFNRDIAWHLVWNCRDTTSFLKLSLVLHFWLKLLLHYAGNDFTVQWLFSSVGSVFSIQERKQSEAMSSRRISKQHEHKAARPLSSELTVPKDSSSTPSSPLAIRSRSSSTTGEDLAGSDTRASPSRELTR